MFVPHKEHTCGPPRPLTGISLIFMRRWCSYLTRNTTVGLHGLLRGYLYFLCVDDVRTSQGTQLWASTTCYGNNSLYLGSFQRTFITCRLRTLILWSSFINPSAMSQFSSEYEGLVLPLLFLWIIIQCSSAVFQSVTPHKHFLSVENFGPWSLTHLQ
jgi:hypothetical protein